VAPVDGPRLTPLPRRTVWSVSPRPPSTSCRTRNMPNDVVPIVAILSVFVFSPLAIAFARIIWRRGSAPPEESKLARENAERLARLESAVDSIAIEMERVSEGQRFVRRHSLSSDRSQIARAMPLPTPSSTSRSTTSRESVSRTTASSNVKRSPPATTGNPLMDADVDAGVIVQSKHLPTAISKRPTLGSAPCTMVLISGELTIDFATTCASVSLSAPVTDTRIKRVAPSPSRARISVMRTQPRRRASANCASSTLPASPLARITHVSDVLVSVSTDSALNEPFTAVRKSRSSVAASNAASVKMYDSIVAMFGSIMPEPLATQVIVAEPTEIDSALGCVSVVMIPSAPTMGSPCNSVDIPTTPASIFSIGSWHTDHAGRTHQHFARRRAKFGGRRSGHASCVLDAARAGGDVAHLAVGDDATQSASPNRLATENDRRARKVVAREDRRRVRHDITGEECEVSRRRLETDIAAGAAKAARAR
jgi:hypothetical protein